MNELDRLFRHLVSTVAATDAERLHDALPLGEVATRLIPYRTSRRAVGAETSEDYELLLVRLASGEGGYVVTEPDAARARFAEEARSLHPDLKVLREFAAATLTLATVPLAQALGGRPADAAYAPPGTLDDAERAYFAEAPDPSPFAPPAARPPAPADAAEPDEDLPLDAIRVSAPPPPPRPAAPVARAAGGGAARPAAAFCPYCGGRLPTGRQVKFCPFCGQSQAPGSCPGCGDPVEEGWRHCVSCGHAVG